MTGSTSRLLSSARRVTLGRPSREVSSTLLAFQKALWPAMLARETRQTLTRPLIHHQGYPLTVWYSSARQRALKRRSNAASYRSPHSTYSYDGLSRLRDNSRLAPVAVLPRGDASKRAEDAGRTAKIAVEGAIAGLLGGTAAVVIYLLSDPFAHAEEESAAAYNSSTYVRQSALTQPKSLMGRQEGSASSLPFDCGQAIGSGSFGKVYMGFDRQSGERVAVKSLAKIFTARQDFLRELSMLEAVRDSGGHRNIVHLRAVAEDNDRFYIVTDFLGGETLHDYLKEIHRCPERMAARFVRDVAAALAFLHQSGIVHNDVKPENLLVVRSQTHASSLKLIDFGSAVNVHAPKVYNEVFPVSQQETSQSLRFSGTREYCPTELVDGGDPTPAADMWSVGCVLYIMLTGAHPFDADGNASEEEIVNRIRQGEIDVTLPAWNKLSDKSKTIAMRLLEKDPAKRMTAEELMTSPWLDIKPVMLE